MSQKIEPVEFGRYYHIYNRGINGENIFKEKANYLHFLNLYDRYIEPITETFAWCLMPNHFHFLVRIKEENEIDKNKLPVPTNLINPVRVLNTDRVNKVRKTGRNKIKYPSRYFSDLFNSYTQAINKRYERHGGLFERPFRRININDERYYKNLVIYIHNNPVHHGFVEHTLEYAWTSYLTVKSHKPTKLMRKEVLDWFDDFDNFEYLHKRNNENIDIERYIIE